MMLNLFFWQRMMFHKVHEISYFKKTNWLKKFICNNTQKRNEATKVFEKAVYKVLINAFYGKTLRNVGNRVLIKFKRMTMQTLSKNNRKAIKRMTMQTLSKNNQN